MQKSMKAALVPRFGEIVIGEAPIPLPQDHEVQIAVKYAGVNPVDWKIAEGLLQTRMPHIFPITLGWDVAGEISQIGSQVTRFKVGDPVFAYCRKETIHDGSFAEFICLNSSNVAPKPHSLSFAEAAAIPLSALTAWQSLYDTAHLKTREAVLIHAGAGGVGSFAIQFAKLTGAHVITTASHAKTEYVKKLGADEVIDYTQESFVTALHRTHPEGVDVVYDTVGNDTLRTSYQVVKEGGRLVTIAGVVDKALAAHHHLDAEYVFVRPDGEELGRIGLLLDTHKVCPPHIQEIPFTEVNEALNKSREGHTLGKIVLRIS